MTRLILITLLVLSSGTAYAEWVSVGSDGKLTIYVDPDTIRREGDIVELWELLDFKTIQVETGRAHWKPRISYLSTMIQYDFDCALERTRARVQEWFSGNMGSDNMVSIDADADNWRLVAPENLSHPLWKIACPKE